METNMIIGMKDIPNLDLISDDEDVDDETLIASDMFITSQQDEVSSKLLKSGPITGVAAAALVTSQKRPHKAMYKFEFNPTYRKRQHTRLIKKLKHTIHELCTRCGQQAVVVCVSPGKSSSSCRVFGSSPLDQIVKEYQDDILRAMEKKLEKNVQTTRNSGLFVLPPISIDGIPTSVDELNQVSWTQALRQIVKNCYRYHGRDDLLLCSSAESNQTNKSPSSELNDKIVTSSDAPPTLVQTVHNADGSVSLIQVDSGQTIATISRDQTGSAVATFSDPMSDDGQLDVTLNEMTNAGWTIATQDTDMGDAYAGLSGVGEDPSDPKQSGDMLPFNSGDVVDASRLSEAAVVSPATHVDTTAMVQIPFSVYEKLAHSIQQSGSTPTVAISSDGRMQLQAEMLDPSPQKIGKDFEKPKR